MTQNEIEDIIEWDIVNWKNALLFWERHLPTHKSLHCLELGGRRGGPSLWLALKGHQVICSDLENPEEHAKLLHDKYKVSERISYEAINALEIPYENEFDIIIFKSIIGGISRSGRDELKKKIIDQAYRALKPGGQLFFAENLESSALHRFARKRFVKWGSEWNYLKFKEIQPILKDFSSVEYDTVGFFGAFGRSEKQRSVFGKIDKVFKLILPKAKRYIVFGVAKK